MRHPGTYTPASLGAAFDLQLERILADLPAEATPDVRARYRRARDISEAMIGSGAFDPT
jgi:hypothetical protein